LQGILVCALGKSCLNAAKTRPKGKITETGKGQERGRCRNYSRRDGDARSAPKDRKMYGENRESSRTTEKWFGHIRLRLHPDSWRNYRLEPALKKGSKEGASRYGSSIDKHMARHRDTILWWGGKIMDRKESER